MRICLFEDRRVADLEPLTLTRPAFDLFCGQTLLSGKQCRYFAPCTAGVLVRPYLVDLVRLQQPATPVNDLAWLRAEPTVLVNGRWLPPPGNVTVLSSPCVALVGEEVAYVVLSPDRLTYCSPNTLDDCLETWKQTLPHRAAGGALVGHAWDLVAHNARQLTEDFRQGPARHRAGWRPTGLAVVGPEDQLVVDPTAHVDPQVVADTTRGPVVIDREAVISAFTRLEGPCYVGPQTQLTGAKIRAGTTLGPNCRIGGEVEASIVHGHSNKYHDGFLGHSYVGEWVNLGAGTSNSDLRNDYGEVSVPVAGRPVATGLTKVGCFLGDHTKTGLGTLLNTGTSVGAFCNLLPTGTLLPKYVPSFCSWWKGTLTPSPSLSRLFQTAAEVMGRRGYSFTEVHAALYRMVFDQTQVERQRALRDEQPSRLRRSA
jgi:UDP-N-acetylglucosamine diphosphorylase/glucosamine-1-phosphate N-acetyltransferase